MNFGYVTVNGVNSNEKAEERIVARMCFVVYIKLVDCLEKCLIYGHIRRFAD